MYTMLKKSYFNILTNWFISNECHGSFKKMFEMWVVSYTRIMHISMDNQIGITKLIDGILL